MPPYQCAKRITIGVIHCFAFLAYLLPAVPCSEPAEAVGCVMGRPVRPGGSLQPTIPGNREESYAIDIRSFRTSRILYLGRLSFGPDDHAVAGRKRYVKTAVMFMDWARLPRTRTAATSPGCLPSGKGRFVLKVDCRHFRSACRLAAGRWSALRIRGLISRDARPPLLTDIRHRSCVRERIA
jgi:hypothetical protein